MNQLGGYARIKLHMLKAHNLDVEVYRAMAPTTVDISQQLLYARCKAELRYSKAFDYYIKLYDDIIRGIFTYGIFAFNTKKFIFKQQVNRRS